MKFADMQPQIAALRTRWNEQAIEDARRPEIDVFAPCDQHPSSTLPQPLNESRTTTRGQKQKADRARDELIAWAQSMRLAAPELCRDAKLTMLDDSDPFLRSPPVAALMPPFVRRQA